MHLIKQLKISIVALAVLILLGTAGYMVIEGWRLLDAFYMTIITIATVGYREVHELSDGGMIFTTVLVVFGVSVLWYTIGKFAQIMFEGQLESLIGRKKVEKRLDALKDHYIVCGYGRIGSLICR